MTVSKVKQAWRKTSKLFLGGGGWGGLPTLLQDLCSTGKNDDNNDEKVIVNDANSWSSVYHSVETCYKPVLFLIFRIRQAMRIQKQMTSRPETIEDQKKEYNMSIVLVNIYTLTFIETMLSTQFCLHHFIDNCELA